MPVYSAARERDILAGLAGQQPRPVPEVSAIEPVFREIISATRALERRLRIAFLGPEGTYSHLAARRHFGEAADLLPTTTIGDVFAAVERGPRDLGVVPVENTTEGVVTQTLDAFIGCELTICGRSVAAHLPSPPFAQRTSRRTCGAWRRSARCSPSAACGSSETCRAWSASRPRAVRRRRVWQPRTRSIAADRQRARGYGLWARHHRGGHRRPPRQHHALRLARARAPARSGRESDLGAVFTVSKAQSGALHRLLDPFAQCGVNLTSIQSRPMPGKPFEYLFFLDMEGHRDDPP